MVGIKVIFLKDATGCGELKKKEGYFLILLGNWPASSTSVVSFGLEK